MGIDSIFIAPEVINGDSVPTARADTWSLGIILYLLITGGLKEDSNSEGPQMDFYDEAWSYMSDEIKVFVEECLEPDPSQRKYVAQLMEHEFIQRHRGNNLDKNVQKEMHIREDGQEIINCYKLQIANFVNEIIHR